MAQLPRHLSDHCLFPDSAGGVGALDRGDRFRVSQQPGWHITSFPPYFVAGALYSGCAAIITLFIILRYVFRFEEYMTMPILKKIVQPDLRHCDGVDLPELDRVCLGLVRHDPYAKQAC